VHVAHPKAGRIVLAQIAPAPPVVKHAGDVGPWLPRAQDAIIALVALEVAQDLPDARGRTTGHAGWRPLRRYCVTRRGRPTCLQAGSLTGKSSPRNAVASTACALRSTAFEAPAIRSSSSLRLSAACDALLP
jgi:hypothetical protein